MTPSLESLVDLSLLPLIPDPQTLQDVVDAHHLYDPPNVPLVLDSLSVPYVPGSIEMSLYESIYE